MDKTIIFLLAGGRSSRYNRLAKSDDRDKLLSPIGNLTLLEYVIKEINSLTPIYIVTRDELKYNTYEELFIKNKNVKVLKENLEYPIGPLGGIFFGLHAFPSTPTKIFIPADLPFISKSTLNEFINKVSKLPNFDLISIVHKNGQTENLFLAVNGPSLIRDIEFLIKHNNYRVSSLIRIVSKKCFLNSSTLSSKKEVWREFIDRDTGKKRVENIRTHNKDSAVISDLIFMKNHDPSLLFRKYLYWKNNNSALERKIATKPIKEFLVQEAKMYRNKGLLSISLHCLFDADEISEDPMIKKEINKLKNLLDN